MIVQLCNKRLDDTILIPVEAVDVLDTIVDPQGMWRFKGMQVRCELICFGRQSERYAVDDSGQMLFCYWTMELGWPLWQWCPPYCSGIIALRIAMQIMSIVAHEAHWMLEGINLSTVEVLEHVPAGSSHFETLFWLVWAMSLFVDGTNSSWKLVEAGIEP